MVNLNIKLDFGNYYWISVDSQIVKTLVKSLLFQNILPNLKTLSVYIPAQWLSGRASAL